MKVLDNIQNNTFVCVNGGSLIDIIITTTNTVNLYVNQYTDDEVELFTGTPSRGHLPVWTEMNLKSPNTETLVLCMEQN